MASAGLLCLGCVGRDNPDYVPDAAVLVKTHHQSPERWQKATDVLSAHRSKRWTRWPEDIRFRVRDISRFGGRAVLLVRNPYESLLSFWNHERSNSYDGGGDVGLKHLYSSGLSSELFHQHATLEISLWRELYLDYLTMGSDLLVVHHEDLKDDAERELRRVHEHLGLAPVDEERLRCSLTQPFDRIRRRPPAAPLKFDPFLPGLRDAIDAAMREVQDMMRFRGLGPLPDHKYKYCTWRNDDEW